MSVFEPNPLADTPAYSDAVIWGICGQTAACWGVSVVVVRAAIVVLAVAGGFGVVVYAALGVWLRLRTERAAGPREPSAGRDLGVAVLTAGVVWELGRWWPGVRPELVVPVAFVAMGIAVGWRAPAVGDRPGAGAAVGDRTGAGVGAQTSRSVGFGQLALRVFGGAAMTLAGLAVVFGQRASLSELRDTGLALAVALAGVGVVMGPAAVRLVRGLGAERDERIRGQERAAVAAHLHDSVLQTLTLIQKRSEDPATMAALARQQERSLRRWLYGGGEVVASLEDIGWRGRAERIAADIEDAYYVAVELVMVGEGESSPAIDAALLASREALVNAAKFSGVADISMYCERTEGRFDVYIHDRGAGFDLDAVAPDRRGISDSMIGRMERVGGRATITPVVGEGTEVHLEVEE